MFCTRDQINLLNSKIQTTTTPIQPLKLIYWKLGLRRLVLNLYQCFAKNQSVSLQELWQNPFIQLGSTISDGLKMISPDWWMSPSPTIEKVIESWSLIFSEGLQHKHHRSRERLQEMYDSYGGFLKCGYPQIIYFQKMFHYKPSSCWSTPVNGKPLKWPMSATTACQEMQRNDPEDQRPTTKDVGKTMINPRIIIKNGGYRMI